MLAGAGYVPAAQRANSSAMLAELRTRFGEESPSPDPEKLPLQAPLDSQRSSRESQRLRDETPKSNRDSMASRAAARRILRSSARDSNRAFEMELAMCLSRGAPSVSAFVAPQSNGGSSNSNSSSSSSRGTKKGPETAAPHSQVAVRAAETSALAPEPVIPQALPVGWRALRDKSGHAFYVRPDGGTQWEFPGEAQLAEQAVWYEAELKRRDEEAQAEVARFEAMLEKQELAEKHRQEEQRKAVKALEDEREAARLAIKAEQAAAAAIEEAERLSRAAAFAQAETQVAEARRARMQMQLAERDKAREAEAVRLQAERQAEAQNEALQQRRAREWRLQGRQGVAGLLDALRHAYGSNEAAAAEEVVSAALQFAHAHQIKHAKDLIKWNLIDALLLVLPGLTVEEHGSRWKEAVRQAADQVSAAPRPNRLY